MWPITEATSFISPRCPPRSCPEQNPFPSPRMISTLISLSVDNSRSVASIASKTSSFNALPLDGPIKDEPTQWTVSLYPDWFVSHLITPFSNARLSASLNADTMPAEIHLRRRVWVPFHARTGCVTRSHDHTFARIQAILHSHVSTSTAPARSESVPLGKFPESA